jgi:hypothetical protein
MSQDPLYSYLPRLLFGVSCLQNGRFVEAIGPLKEVMTQCNELGIEELGTPACLYLGAALVGKGCMAEGFRLIEGARRSYMEHERKYFYAQSEYILGCMYSQIAERKAPVTISSIANNMGFIVKNVPFAGKKAEAHFNKAIEVADEIGAKGTLGQAYLDLGLLHRAKKRTQMARGHLSKAAQIFRETEAEFFLKQAEDALASLG